MPQLTARFKNINHDITRENQVCSWVYVSRHSKQTSHHGASARQLQTGGQPGHHLFVTTEVNQLGCSYFLFLMCFWELVSFTYSHIHKHCWQNFNLLLIVAITGRALHLATSSYTDTLNKLKMKVIRYLKYNIDYSYYSSSKTLKTPQFITPLYFISHI